MRLNVLVGEVMTKNVMAVALDDPIDKAARIMRDNGIGSVVVIGEKNVKGIVTTTDIVYRHVAEGKGRVVSDIMTRNIVSIEPTKTIEDAARLMVEKAVEKLLVFDMGKLVGVITNNDIIRIEPTLYEILLERMKMGGRQQRGAMEFAQCEVCGNYTDDVEESDGMCACSSCREK